MTRLRALIVDDEELARRGLCLRLQKISGIEVCGESRNGSESISAVSKLKPDVIFLDIQMPGMNGFQVLNSLVGGDTPIVIFVTAYDEYAIRAFDANAVDYLLKPINDERLRSAVLRAQQIAEQKRATDHRAKLLQLVCSLTGENVSLDEALDRADGVVADYPDRLAIKDGGQAVCVEMNSIDWIDAAGDYMCVHVAGKTYVIRGTMKRLEEVLDPKKFVRVHRSAIVNRDRVVAMRPHLNGEYFLTLVGDRELKLSRKYKDNLPRLVEKI